MTKFIADSGDTLSRTVVTQFIADSGDTVHCGQW